MKILISVPVYNRKELTELVLQSLNRHKQDAELHVYNDWSTEYDNKWLKPMADEVFKLPASDKIVVRNESNTNGMGVQHLRWHQMREFMKQDKFDFLYCTDSDAIHDPDYITVLKTVYQKYNAQLSPKQDTKLPLCLYNTRFHRSDNDKRIDKDLIMCPTAPGISHFYSKSMVATMVQKLDQQEADPDYGWDFLGPRPLRVPWLTTMRSYVEHLGAYKTSMHTPPGHWDRDRALNPTDYLANIRPRVIDYLEGRGAKPEL